MVEDDPRDVERARRAVGRDRVRDEAGGAPVAELFQGHRGGGAAGEIGDAVGRGQLRRGELLFQHRQQVARVQAVAHLVAVAAEAEILEWTPPQPAVDPVGEDALVGAAELPRAREHAAAVDEHREAEHPAVFERQRLGGELGRAVERDRGVRSKALSNTGSTGTYPNTVDICCRVKRLIFDINRKFAQGIY